MKRFRDYYGAQPLHLLATIASFAIVAAGFVRWFDPGSDSRDILAWLVASAVGFELVLLPLAWLLDRVAFGLAPSRPSHGAARGAGSAYIRVPALLSGLLLLVFVPLILRLGQGTFAASTGMIPSGYLARWLIATAGLFGCSAAAYAVSLARARRQRSPQDAPESDATIPPAQAQVTSLGPRPPRHRASRGHELREPHPITVPTESLLTPVAVGTSAGWVLLPALGAALAHAPVLRWNLIPALGRPISRRLFGENKTWRGALVMTAGTVAATLVLHRLPNYRRRLPQPVADASPLLTGTLLGGACWLGELPNSYLKRRIGIAPGEQRASPTGVAISIFDQADWVPMAWLLLRPVWKLDAREAAQAFVLVAAVHVPINLIGYAVGARTSPL